MLFQRRRSLKMVDDGRTTEHGYTISSPCEPDGSGELKNLLLHNLAAGCNLSITSVRRLSKAFRSRIFKSMNQLQSYLSWKETGIQMSHLMRKSTVCICKNKDNREADQHLCFCYTDSTLPLLLKSEISIGHVGMTSYR